MFRTVGGVKFRARRVCPMWHGLECVCRATKAGEPVLEEENVGIRGTPGRAGAVRTDVRKGARKARGLAGPDDQCAGAGRSARRVLHESAEPGRTGDGSENDYAGTNARERVGAGRHGGIEASARVGGESQELSGRARRTGRTARAT